MIYKDKISEAVEFLKTKLPKKPQIAMVLGSGLGGFAKEIPSAIDIPYEIYRFGQNQPSPDTPDSWCADKWEIIT